MRIPTRRRACGLAVLGIFLCSLVPAQEPAPAGLGEPPTPIAERLAWIRAKTWERRWRTVPWQESLTRALEVARASGKPVFFFGGDGDMDTGNC